MEIDKLIEFAVKGLIISNNKFLAVHKANIKSERLEFPGGRMVFGETAEDTLQREMKEEIGFDVEPLRVIDTWNYVIDDTRQITGVIYLCKGKETENVVLSDEHDRYEWLEFNLESISKMNRLFASQMEKWDWEELLSFIK